jgi:hypothetical protein
MFCDSVCNLGYSVDDVDKEKKGDIIVISQTNIDNDENYLSQSKLVIIHKLNIIF